jgi:uncharacterized protein (TIGR02646 family)
MRPQSRQSAPDFLVAKWEEWGLLWEKRLARNKQSKWHWRKIDREKVNHKLMPLLKKQANEHCSFCDAFPVSPPSNDTIEHFRPKAKYPRLAWKWENLYFCCDFCQGKKLSHWEDSLLAPDDPLYQFTDYFFADSTNGRIEIRPDLDPGSAKHQQAECTLRIYALNDGGHLTSRLAEQERRSALPDWDIDKFAYRDFLGV